MLALMLTSAHAPICGNAAILTVVPPEQADYVAVLRRPDASFVGIPDAGATEIHRGEGGTVVDVTVANGTVYFYKDYAFYDGAFHDDEAAPLSVTPASTYVPFGPDVRKLVRDRLDLGYRQEILRGLLVIKPPAAGAITKIPVVTAPPDSKTTAWPVVSVKVLTDTPQDRGVGEQLLDGSDTPNETALDIFAIEVTCWSQNPDERHALHEATRRIVMANLSVFAAMGLDKVEWRQQDVDYLDGTLFDGLVYSAVMTLTCESPVGVIAQDQNVIVADINVIPTAAPIVDGIAQIDTGQS